MPYPVPPSTRNVSTDKLMRASWRRCADDYRFDRDFQYEIEIVDGNHLREAREPMHDVLVTSTAVIKRIRKIAMDVGYVMLISNHEGVVVESFADCTSAQELASEGLRMGSVWRESQAGTNGVGTAIISRQALTVHGGAHYNDLFRSYTCSAAPVFSSDGKVIASLDLSGKATSNSSDEYRFAEYFVSEAAQQISMQLFRYRHQGDCLVALSGQPDPMPMSCKALVATNEDGEILGATTEAYALLGVPELSELGARRINDLWNVALEDLKPLSAHNVPVRTEGGATAYVTAFLPKLKKSNTTRHYPQARSAAPSTHIDTKQKPLDRMAGNEPNLRGIVDLCRRIINKDLPILLLGETGVGKDTLARALHDESERRLRPYVAVNCAAIPASLLASELFGYVGGSFTGAARNGRVGKIQASDTGTLFLDEIGDMPLDLQAHLLRVLEDRTVMPLGSTETIPVDFKIICATHQDLPQLVESGKFRRDLYFRIKGVQVIIPSLHARSDIPDLVRSIATEEADVTGQTTPAFSNEAMAALETYSWPGNIRELRSVIRLVMSIYPDQKIEPWHLPDEIKQAAAHREAATSLPDSTFPPATVSVWKPTTLSEAHRLAEERSIREALRTQKWNITNAAKQLGISRATLHRKICRFGIVSPNNLE